jgi:hypothetical protein
MFYEIKHGLSLSQVECLPTQALDKLVRFKTKYADNLSTFYVKGNKKKTIPILKHELPPQATTYTRDRVCTELERPPERRDHQSPKVTRLTSSRPRMA